MLEAPSTEVNLAEHCAVLAWRQLHPSSVEPERIDILKRKKRKSEVYRLAGIGPKGTDVIAKRCPSRNATVERLVHEELLRALRLPTLRLFGSLPDPDGQCCWLFLEDAGPGTYSSTSQEHRALAARWLAALHQACFSPRFPGALPARRGPFYRQRLRWARQRLEDALCLAPLDAEQRALLETVVAAHESVDRHWAELEECCEAWPTTLVHGDFVPKNLRLRPGAGGPVLLVFDWEMGGWGTRATDLAHVLERTASPDLQVYAAALAERGSSVGLCDLQRLAACGTLLRLLDEVVWEAESMVDNTLRVVLKPVMTIAKYEPLLAAALRVLEWS